MSVTELAPSSAVVESPAGRSRRPRRTLRPLYARLAWGLLGVSCVSLAWEAATRSGVIGPTLMPTFSATCVKLGALVVDTAFWGYVGLTLRAWAIGLALAVAIAVPAGIVLGLSDRAYRFVRIPLEAIRPVPPIVLLPLALLVLGGGIAFQSTLIVQGAMWPLLVMVAYAIRSADPVALETAATFRFGAWRTLLFVRLPAAAPLMASGLRLGAAGAFGVTLVSELLGGQAGMGTLLMIGQSSGDVALVYAVTLMTGLIGLAIAAVFGALERPVMSWRAAS